MIPSIVFVSVSQAKATGTAAVKPVVIVVAEPASKFPQANSPPRLSTKLIAITPVPALVSSEYYIV